MAPGARRPSLRGLSAVERALRLFTDVRAGEGTTGVVMLATVFLLLAAYYFVKPARDGLLATSPVQGLSDVELKAYSSFGQSFVLMLAIPAYDRLVSALDRRALVTGVTLFFAATFAGFWTLQPGLFLGDAGWVGIAFYLWVGIFNVFVVAQFWGFASDLYSDEAGRRLFPMIAIGATGGAASGSWAASALVKPIGTYGLLLVAAGLLVASTVFVAIAARRGPTGQGFDDGDDDREGADRSGGLRLVFRHRYLLATALLILTLNWVNTNGENFLFGVVQDRVNETAAARGVTGAEHEAFVRDATTRFYGDLFFWVNVSALLLQAFVASRVLRHGGFAVLLLSVPVVSLLSYSAMALVPALGVIRLAKIAENAMDYSLNNTAKQVLWLPTTRAMKYKAKAAIDTIFVRVGDVCAALTAFAAVNLLDLPIRWLFAANAGLVLVWLALAVFVARERDLLPRAALARQAA